MNIKDIDEEISRLHSRLEELQIKRKEVSLGNIIKDIVPGNVFTIGGKTNDTTFIIIASASANSNKFITLGRNDNPFESWSLESTLKGNKGPYTKQEIAKYLEPSGWKLAGSMKTILTSLEQKLHKPWSDKEL